MSRLESDQDYAAQVRAIVDASPRLTPADLDQLAGILGLVHVATASPASEPDMTTDQEG